MADAPKELSLPRSFPQGQVILAVGRWSSSERYKGADDLIRSIAQLRTEFPGLHLVAVGAGDDLPRLQELTADLNVTDRVHFFQGLSRAEIAACYSRADIFALPSTGEGFGIVYLEAMAFSKPVVGAACGGTTDLIEDGMNGLLVPPRDTVALVACLRRLLSNEALQNNLGRRGADMVRQKYRFGVFEADLEHLLYECGLVSQPGG
jgi:phosphatidyl-myo-inositol dimannoside synthase